ncbi:MAG: hypothetical protein RR539_02280 [Clostridium sp.]|uniref:hypothetical protein n=1 Tax=Clostridium sp. TaxID=1506 RepID=UPI002FCB170D
MEINKFSISIGRVICLFFIGGSERAIVKWSKDNKNYIYMGCAFSYYQSKIEGYFGGVLFPNVEEGTHNLILLSDEGGNLLWVNAPEVTLVSINGESPSEILK